MAEDDVALFTINLGGDGGTPPPPPTGSGATPNPGDGIGRLVNVTNSILKSVTSIESILRSMDRKMTQGSPVQSSNGPVVFTGGVGPNARARRAASSATVQASTALARTTGLARVSRYSGWSFGGSRAEEVFRGFRPQGYGTGLAIYSEAMNTFQSRFGGGSDFIDAETVGPSPPPRPGSRVAPPPRPGGQRGRAGKGGGKAAGARIPSILSGLNYGNAYVALRGLGAIGGVAAAGYVGYALAERARQAGLSSISSMGQFSGPVAGMNAQIQMATLQRNIAVANSPQAMAAAQAQTLAELRYQNGGAQSAGTFGAAFRGYAGTMGTNLLNSFWTDPLRFFGGKGFAEAMGLTLKDTLIGALKTALNPNAGNDMFYSGLDEMMGGLLRNQDRLPPGVNFGQATLGAGSRGVTPLSRKEWKKRHP